MSRHKYFEELKNKPWWHPSDLGLVNDKRSSQWHKERRNYGFDNRETWNLNYTFYVWLYEHLMMFKAYASKVIDLDFHTFEYKGETLTQLDCINRMIEGCKVYIANPDELEISDEEKEKVDCVLDLWKLVLPIMWW